MHNAAKRGGWQVFKMDVSPLFKTTIYSKTNKANIRIAKQIELGSLYHLNVQSGLIALKRQDNKQL